MSHKEVSETAQQDVQSRTHKTVSEEGHPESLVKLNIGGYKYVTTRCTLLSPDEKTFFSALLEGRVPVSLDDEGAYFIDHNGKDFGPILDYLRTGKLQIPADTNVSSVYDLANFFLVPLPPMSSRLTDCVVGHQEKLMTMINSAPILNNLKCDRVLVLPYSEITAVSLACSLLTQSQFLGTAFTHVDMTDVRFERCDLRNCTFKHCTFDRGHFLGCIFSGSQFIDCTFKGAVIRNISDAAHRSVTPTPGTSYAWPTHETDMRNAVINGCNFLEARLKRVNLSGSLMEDTSFAKADMQHVDLRSVRLFNVGFDLVQMAHTSFDGSHLIHVRFIGARLGGEIDAESNPFLSPVLELHQRASFDNVTFNNSLMNCVNFYHTSFYIDHEKFFEKTFNNASVKNILCHSVLNHWSPDRRSEKRDFGINTNRMRMAFLRSLALHSHHMASTLDHPVNSCPALREDSCATHEDIATIQIAEDLNGLRM
ncbi:hypothetical protein SARC_06986 [Sphaeroforma arctica JP610]|uniref:BTB domain-containing protein n=1 Tax=Sphaeroforma arctica JP610 TaxID=667725 RepID=A0A0L0FV19_9EUKA|nr:hypothetical protein SARC_06986 [Sphaeroforma arctica JP610]KNC80672.1 hypothetical protein SARC_06986 [Sphaeroforma arctica JP610]|eukprot:XP_014154574.1 hypothetical protein SARC_06986 [Sphaeroforma arctica JP610]